MAGTLAEEQCELLSEAGDRGCEVDEEGNEEADEIGVSASLGGLSK
jgi:hypothetical protein